MLITEMDCVMKQPVEVVGEKRELISLPAMGQRQRRAVYGKSVRVVRCGVGGRKTSSYSTGWGSLRHSLYAHYCASLIRSPNFSVNL